MSPSLPIPGPIVLASDHGGFALKQAIARHLGARSIPFVDAGTHGAEACDYPVFARAAAEVVARGEAWRGIVVDGMGIGSGMVANKVPGIRAAMAFDVATAKSAREHNDANVLTLGGSILSEEMALKIVDAFLSTECTADRHKRRVAMIDALDAPHSSAKKNELMASPSSDRESLVQAIMQVLAANPSLLAAGPQAIHDGAASGPKPRTDGAGAIAAHGAGAPNLCPDGQCIACGRCVSKRVESVRAALGEGRDASGGRGVRLTSALGLGAVPGDIAKLIDHTLLRPEATYADIDKLCDEARTHGFASVCVNPMHVKRCAQRLQGASSVVCTVVGFPLGSTPSEIKALEARRAIRDGAREIDMVIAIGALKSGDLRYVQDDIRMVAEAAHDGRAILKVILETALLTDEEKVAGCVAAKKARADFVKTSTGFSKGGATVHDIALMAGAVDGKLGVKASGGIGSAADANAMIQAGATRIGASVGVKIVQEAKGQAQGGSRAGSSKASAY